MTRPRIVLFDIDNTLIRAGGAGRRALERALREVAALDGRAGGIFERVRFSGRTDPSILRDLLAAAGLAPTAALMEAIFGRYVELLPGEVEAAVASSRQPPGPPSGGPQPAQPAAAREGARGGEYLLPGVRETIAALARLEDVHLGLLTGNIRPGARIKLAPLALNEPFAFGAFGDDAEERPALFPIALSRWRAAVAARCGGAGAAEPACDPADVYVVGDTVLDVAVAKAHGARSVAVGTGGPWQDREELLATRPDFFFDDLTAASTWLNAMERERS